MVFDVAWQIPVCRTIKHEVEERTIMKWYNDITEQEKRSFNKVIAVCVVGAILILFIPMIWHFIL